MKYAQTTGLSHARKRKRRRSLIVLVIVSLAVVVGTAYAAAYTSGLIPGSRPPQKPASCSPTKIIYPNAGFTVNVYNASRNQGKAKEVARALKSHHFSMAVVSNDPYAMKLTDVGQVRYGPKGAAKAKQFVVPLIPGVQELADGRDDDSVDVVLGDQFPDIAVLPSPTSSTPPGC
ncbi:LytR C-terminal domain-containing protein [Yimella sp. cx-51]|uniref:LytR C-terminal domain-containing protein n=1 Tax=Yimella sp. cx-51 TaxID=2770551 RepID=UPI00165D5320|nr:LytR C-terminal domain-containing protein [Yimella sp. cx-51]MBC9956501.1 LytR C-terminal domain-containing protein [Yimella sp. cx-51]MBD2759968.1 LytR C-terminal domain-containing protein [Yimella sp. cx-573]QTH38390.1 LytR C-terminal domain-containing protein [Yimella sp. cx-51]